MSRDPLPDNRWHELLRLRATRPHAVADAYARRQRPGRIVGSRGTLFLVAADHPARGALGVPGDPLGMADRRDLLRRLLIALEHPDVDGLLGSPDVVEELLLLGALEGKVVIGSMNRGGLYGAGWTMDDRFTGYDAAGIAGCGLEGGKMLLRIDDDDAGTARTIEGCANAVTGLAARGLVAMVEPLPYARDGDGALVLQRDAGSLMRAVTVASALGATSAYTWLKLPVVPDMTRVMRATTLPTLLLGGDSGRAPEETYASWGEALALPGVRGLVVGRTLLYPDDDDVDGAIDTAARLVRRDLPPRGTSPAGTRLSAPANDRA